MGTRRIISHVSNFRSVTSRTMLLAADPGCAHGCATVRDSTMRLADIGVLRRTSLSPSERG